MSFNKILSAAGRRSVHTSAASAGPKPNVHLDVPKQRAWIDNIEYTLVNSRARKFEKLLSGVFLGIALCDSYTISSRDKQD